MPKKRKWFEFGSLLIFMSDKKMKDKHTNDRLASFEIWRKNNVGRFGDFIWIQINYDINSANTIAVIFEQKANTNLDIKFMAQKLCKIPYFVLNFTDINSPCYTDGSDLHDKLGLVITNKLSSKIISYWDYRLQTRPKNCLTADIDSIELTNSANCIAIEAAQLYDTSTINMAIKHIFRTFKFRPNKVNEKQYLSQYKFMQNIHGKAFILFHIVERGCLDETKPVLLIENDENFYNMLCDIKGFSRYDELIFVGRYEKYLYNNLKQYDDIFEAYDYIKSL